MCMKRWAAALLALLLLPTLVAAKPLPDSYQSVNSALDCALYAWQQFERGAEAVYVTVPAGTDGGAFFYDVHIYIRMLYAEYHTLYHWQYGATRNYGLSLSLEGLEAGRGEAEAAAQAVVSQIIQPAMTVEEKLLALHQYVSDNCVYDYKAAMNKHFASRRVFSACGMLVDGVAVCDGYSAAFALLCKYAGIPCMQIISEDMADGAGHSWNAVLLDDQVLYIDVTFNDTSGVPGDLTFYLKTEAELKALGHGWDSAFAQKMIDAVWGPDFKAARALNRLGLFNGTAYGFELERAPSRSEASLMLLRLLGLEAEALAQGAGLACPYDDVNAFYQPYVAYLHDRALTQGTSSTTFSPEQPIGVQQYMTFILRALGYDDRAGDFDWRQALATAVEVGVLSSAEAGEIGASTFDRGHMAYISLRALLARQKDGTVLGEYLAEAGRIDGDLYREIAKNP